MIDWIRRHKFHVLAGLLLLAALLVVSVTRNRRHEVGVVQAEVGSLTLRIAASGIVEGESADLAFQGAGRIVELYVEEGDTINSSDLLARLSPLGTMPNTLGAADVIQAPYDGTVVAIYQRAGAVANPGQPVLRVASAGSRWVTAFIETEDAVYLRPGHKLSCRAGGYLSEAWELTIEEVGSEAIPRPDLPGSSRQVRVRCAVVNPAFPLAAGAEVDIDGEIPLVESALLIPAAAVIHEGPDDWVWAVEHSAVTRREITVGPNDFDRIQVREGLEAGDLVVVEGKADLEEGRQVKATPLPPMSRAFPGDE